MRRDTWSDTRKAWAGSGFPLTIGLMVAQFIGLILWTIKSPAVEYLACVMPESLVRPWTLLTYSILPDMVVGSRIFFSFLFTAGMTYWFCGSLERSWGTKQLAIFYFASSVISVAFLLVAAVLFKTSVLADHLLPIAACAVAWGVLNAEEEITLFFIPMRGIFISLIAVLLVAFDYAQMGIMLVPFALGGCAVAYMWVRNREWSPAGFYSESPLTERRPKLRLVPNKAKSQRPLDDRFTLRDLNPLEWLARRKRQKQLEKLLGDD